MVNEVESILNEIRERVRNEAQGSAPVAISHEMPKDSLARPNGDSVVGSTESLSRLSAHLTTTSRAWDRLPPLYSNRSGGPARLELWLKARLKSMSRWFTWEQVNFNSAVHHALSETLHALSAYQQELARLEAGLRQEGEGWRENFERSDRDLSGLRASIEALTAEIRKRDASIETLTAEIRKRDASLEARCAAIEAATETRAIELAAVMTKEIEGTQIDITSRLAALAGELRESDQQLREEHRVCFKQLSLEVSETAVIEDRGHRIIESRLDKLEKAVSNGDE